MVVRVGCNYKVPVGSFHNVVREFNVKDKGPISLDLVKHCNLVRDLLQYKPLLLCDFCILDYLEFR